MCGFSFLLIFAINNKKTFLPLLLLPSPPGNFWCFPEIGKRVLLPLPFLLFFLLLLALQEGRGPFKNSLLFLLGHKKREEEKEEEEEEEEEEGNIQIQQNANPDQYWKHLFTWRRRRRRDFPCQCKKGGGGTIPTVEGERRRGGQRRFFLCKICSPYFEIGKGSGLTFLCGL